MRGEAGMTACLPRAATTSCFGDEGNDILEGRRRRRCALREWLAQIGNPFEDGRGRTQLPGTDPMLRAPSWTSVDMLKLVHWLWTRGPGGRCAQVAT
jgi:hypothetical protein